MGDLYMSWKNVGVTPAGGSAIAIDGVTDVMVDGQSLQEAFFGDGRKFAALIANTRQARSIEIVGGNVGALASIPMNLACAVTATLANPAGGVGVGSGALKVDLANAMCQQKPFTGSDSKFASARAKFNAYGDASDTDPLTITEL